MQNNQNDSKKQLHAVRSLQNPLQQDDDLHIPPRKYARNGMQHKLDHITEIKN